MRRSVRNKVKCLLLGLLCMVIAGGIGFFYYTDRSFRRPETEDTQAFVSSSGAEDEEGKLVVIDDTVYRYTDDIETILFIGTDESGNQINEEEEYHGAMADMLMVVVVNHTKQEFSVLQLNRDTITNVYLLNEDGEEMANAELQLCTAHWYGGSEQLNCENTVRSVSELMGGIEIDNYYSLTWEGIPALNAVVDGVTVTIENDFSGVDASLIQGETITLTDEQAYSFLRSRKGVDDGENTGRMERQRRYMTAWMQKVREKTAEDSGFAAVIFQSLSPYAYTDINGSSINTTIQPMLSYTNRGIFTIDGTVSEGKRLGDDIVHTEFFPDDDSRLDVLETLYDLEEDDGNGIRIDGNEYRFN